MIAIALVVPLVLQAVAMMVDELHFHRARGLGRWERLGHPLDTLTVAICLAWVLGRPPTPASIAAYAALAAGSCLFVTKDEPVHARRCSGGEHWLHAVLFVLHPLCLLSAGLLWPAVHFAARDLPGWLAPTAPLASIVRVQLLLTVGFAAYQALYWNIRWPGPRVSR